MQPDKTYILNPAYYLRHDEKRALLGSYSETDTECRHTEALMTIHPLVAQMLSFFDGERTYGEAIKEISAHFELPESEVQEILIKYTENEIWAGSEGMNYQLNIPENVLVEKNEMTRREYYSADEFPYRNGDVDMSYGRLYKPVSCLLELTMKCYTDCIYCYADRRECDNPLSLEEIRKFIRDAHLSGIKEISLNGGEVLMHPDIKEIIEEMVNYNYNSLISTKMPVQEEMLRFLYDHGFTTIQISLDSVNPDTLATHLKVGKNYLEKITRTMDLLDEMGFKWQVNTIVTKYNCSVQEIEGLINHLGNYKNLKKVTVSGAGYSLYKNLDDYHSIRFAQEEYDRVIDRVKEISALYPNMQILGREGTYYNRDCEQRTNEFTNRAVCTANQRSFVVLPDGKVTICEEMYWRPEFLIGDIRQSSILEIWNGEKAKKLFYLPQKSISKKSKCRTCKEFKECRKFLGVCWKLIVEAYGFENWDNPDPNCPQAPPIINDIYMGYK